MKVRKGSTNPMGLCWTLWDGARGTEQRRKEHRSHTYMWEVCGRAAYEVSKEIFPYLVGAQQARLLCLREFYEECFIARGDLGKGLRIPLTVEEQKLRVSFWERMIFITKMETLENSEEIRSWANKAYSTAVRAASRKRKK